MVIDTLEGVQLGGITQWIRVRGADASNPVLLLMQQGPGLPIINDARRLEHLLGLEHAFTVVYWDQRGTGLSSPSLRKNPNRFEISVTRMVDDTVTLLENFNSGLRALLLSLVRSPDYSAADVIRALRGISASLAALLPRLATTDLVRTMPRLDVPLVMAQGRLDQVAPGEAAQRFHDSLTAPSKQLVWFENSAHTPHLEEPAKFRDLLMNVRASQLAST